MNIFKKKSLCAALAGIGALSAAGAAQAVNLNPDGLGQVLLYPYYTVNAGQGTLLSVVNTTDRITCQATTWPVRVSTASPPATTIATACDHCSSRRRSQRSANTPPSGLNMSNAIACAAPTSPVWVTEPVS